MYVKKIQFTQNLETKHYTQDMIISHIMVTHWLYRIEYYNQGSNIRELPAKAGGDLIKKWHVLGRENTRKMQFWRSR